MVTAWSLLLLDQVLVFSTDVHKAAVCRTLLQPVQGSRSDYISNTIVLAPVDSNEHEVRCPFRFQARISSHDYSSWNFLDC